MATRTGVARRARKQTWKSGVPRPDTGSRTIEVAPWIALLLAFLSVFYVYPAFEVVRASFTNASILSERYSYTLETYLRVVLDSTIHSVLITSAIYVVASVTGAIILGLAIALLIRQAERRGLPGGVFLRTVVLAAWITPGVAIGIVWKLILSPRYGLVDSTLVGAGLPPLNFLSTPRMALFSVIIVSIWNATAFSMILQYARLRSIPPGLYEAAAVDGATPFQTFRFVTLPQLRQMILVTMILATIGSLNTFESILALTGGGPGRATEIIALHTYNTVFNEFDLGRGSVLAVIMVLVTLLLAFVYSKVLRADRL